MEVRVSWGPWGIWEPWGNGGGEGITKKKGPRRGLKGPDLGVESGHAEVWSLGVK